VQHIVKQGQRWGVDTEVIAQLRFDIPKMYKFHKKKEVDVEVDLVRFAHRQALPAEAPARPLAEARAAAGGSDDDGDDDGDDI
jgi:hypothetical protein